MASRETMMTYGTMPSRDAFDEAFGGGPFPFGNDKRVGTCEMTSDELWDELQAAHEEWDGGEVEEAGDWCSLVLGALGFEWV